MAARVLEIGALLEARVMLLHCVAVHRIVQEVNEVRIEIEQRARQERVGFPHRAVGLLLPDVTGHCAGADLAAFSWIEEAKTVQQPRIDSVERNLAGRVITVQPAVDLERHRAAFREPAQEIAAHVVAPISERLHKRPVGMRALVCQERIHLLPVRADGQKAALGVKRSSLHAGSQFIRERLAQADVDHAQSAEVTILGAERTVDNVGFLNQFRA